MWKKLLFMLFIAIVISGCATSKETNKSTDIKKEVDDKKEKNKQKEKKDVSSEKSTDKEENKPKYKINQKIWSIDPINNEAEKNVVLLTIDDAPDKYALEMAKKLKEMKVPAIFFVNGHFLESEEKKEQLKKIADMGFEIGNHTYSHKSLPDLSEEEQIEEIKSVNQKVEQIIGKKPDFFRAPFGQNTDKTREFVKDEQMHLMNWTYGYDWDKEYQSESAIKDIMINAPELNDGANLLMHDREWTNEALEGIVNGLREKGYKFVNPKEIEGYNEL